MLENILCWGLFGRLEHVEELLVARMALEDTYSMYRGAGNHSCQNTGQQGQPDIQTIHQKLGARVLQVSRSFWQLSWIKSLNLS